MPVAAAVNGKGKEGGDKEYCHHGGRFPFREDAFLIIRVAYYPDIKRTDLKHVDPYPVPFCISLIVQINEASDGYGKNISQSTETVIGRVHFFLGLVIFKHKVEDKASNDAVLPFADDPVDQGSEEHQLDENGIVVCTVNTDTADLQIVYGLLNVDLIHAEGLDKYLNGEKKQKGENIAQKLFSKGQGGVDLYECGLFCIFKGSGNKVACNDHKNGNCHVYPEGKPVVKLFVMGKVIMSGNDHYNGETFDNIYETISCSHKASVNDISYLSI